MKKFLNIILLALLLTVTITVNAVGFIIVETFDGTSVDMLDSIWNVPSSDGSVISDITTGTNALMLHRGNESLSSSLMAQYSYTAVNGTDYYIDLVFSYSEGSAFQVRNWNGTSWHACYTIEDNTFKYYDMRTGSWRTASQIASEKVHTLRYAINSNNTMDIYLNGENIRSGVSKPSGKTNLFSVYITGADTTLNIYNLAVIGVSGSFYEDFTGATINSLSQNGWTFPDMSSYAQSFQAIVDMSMVGALKFEADERAEMCVVTNSEFSMNGQPASVAFTFMYEENAKMQFRVLNNSGSWIAAFHLNDNELIHQSGSGHKSLATLEPMKEYTLKMTCDTFLANSVNVYLNGMNVATNMSCTAGGALAPKYVQILNLSTESGIYLKKFEADTSAWFKDDYASKGFRPRVEDYTIKGAIASSWTAIDGKKIPSIKSIVNADDYLRIKRIAAGEEYRASCVLENIGDSFNISMGFSYSGYGTNIIKINGNNGIAVKIEDGFIYCGSDNSIGISFNSIGKSINPYEKYTLKFNISQSSSNVFLNGENIFLASGIKNAESIELINAGQNESSLNSRLFSQLCVYEILAQSSENIDFSVVSAKLTALSDKRRVETVQNEPVECEIKLKNNGTFAGAYVMIAVYEGNKLYDIIKDVILLESEGYTAYSKQLPSYSNASNLSTKVYVWDTNFSPVISVAGMNNLISKTDFNVFKYYFNKNGFAPWDDEYEFSPACGKVDIDVKLSSATNISVFSSQRVLLFTVNAEDYSTYMSSGSVLTIFADTKSSGYDLYVDNQNIFGSIEFLTAADNISSITVSNPENIENIQVKFSQKSLVSSITDRINPVYEYGFNDGLPPDLNCIGTVTAGSGYMTIDKSTTGNGTMKGIVQSLPIPVGGTAELSFNFRTHNTTSNTKYRFFINVTNNRAQIWFRLRAGNLYYTDVNGNEHMLKSSISDNVWHTIKIVDYVTRCAMDVYIDSIKVATEISGRSKYFTAIDDVEIYIPGSYTGKIDIDDLKIAPYNDYENPQGYEDYAGAPQLKDLIIPSPPTGEMYYASDMLLENYTIIHNESAIGGSAVRIENEGAGQASFTYNGNGGYYKINACYLENEEPVDSSFRLYHNNKEIDFWYGKYDDGGRHVRSVSNGMYVENGDIFILEGYSSGDGSIFNYIEFIQTQDAVYEKGIYIDDEYWTKSGFKPTSWKFSSRDIKVSEYNNIRSLAIKDESANKSVYASRPFRKIAGKDIVLDIVLDSNISADGADIKIGNLNGYAAILKVQSNRIYCVKDDVLTAVASVSGFKGVRIMLDTQTKTYKVISGTASVTDIAFTENIGYLDRLVVETKPEAIGALYIRSVLLYNGYLCNDDFKVYTRNVLPFGWRKISSTGVVSVSEAGGEMLDTRSLMLSDSSVTDFVKAVREFDEVNDELTISYNMLAKDGFYATIGRGINIYTDEGNIYCNGQLLWENYINTIWYKVCAEIDYINKTATIYINNIKKGEIEITDTSASALSFETDAETTITVYVDDVRIENEIYRSQIEEPNPVDTGDYDIAVQACDLWREGTHFGWDLIRPYDYSTPLGGYYDDGSRKQADLEIKWMTEHGVSVYLPCWFRASKNTKTPIYGEKMDAFLSSPYIDKMKFAIVYENSSGVSSAEDMIDNVLYYWIEHYFKHPSYYLVDNKPVIMIWNADTLFNNLGKSVDANAALFKTIEEILIREGFSGAVFLTNTMGSKYTNETLANCGYDYTYVYSYRNRSVKEQIHNLQSQTGYGFMDAIACISQGWGDEPWGLGERKKNMPLNEWYGALNYFKNIYMPARSSLASKLVLIDNWNEWGEGHAVYPSNFAGFGYLDAVRNIFGTNPGIHKEYLPEIHSNLYIH